MRHWRFRFGFTPTINELARVLFVRPRALYLVENEPVVLLNRLNDLSQLAHNILPL